MPKRNRPILAVIALSLATVFTACIGLAETGEPVNINAERPDGVVNLDGTQWMLTSLDNRHLIEGTHITLNFAGGFVNGFAGCNAYRSLIIGSDKDRFRYTATDDGTLTIPGFMITEKDCSEPEGVMPQEAAYVKALQNAASFQLTDDCLEIGNASGATTLVFVKKEVSPMDPSDLVGTEWVLTTLRGKELVKGTNIILNFTEERIGGFTGCNGYGGEYEAVGKNTLTILEIAVTAQGCLEPEGIMQQEDTYIAALTQANAYRVMDDRLEIENAGGETTLVFARKREFPMEPGDLVDTQWRLVSWNGNSPIEDSTITLAFPTENEFSGHAGCRGYVGTYEASGDDIRFPSLAMTGFLERCSEELMIQESEYTSILELVTNYRLSEGQLELLTARGEVFIFEPLPEDADANVEGEPSGR